jgi:hypothetical protein
MQRKMRLRHIQEWAIKQESIQESIWFLKVQDLKDICNALGIRAGLKGFMIENIIHYHENKLEIPHPSTLKSRHKTSSPTIIGFAPNQLMLPGIYKNDRANREFFKQLIGPHFKFTVAGIDYLKQRWQANNPPTYAEFAAYWSQNHKIMKPEWQYIKFCQANPGLSKQALHAKWKAIYHHHKKIVLEILGIT